MQAFNPNAGALNATGEVDFAQKIAALKRQQMVAEQLRKQANQPGPQGQMVSGHYVAPSILQHLAPLLQQYTAGQAENNAARGEADLARQTGQAQQAWQSSLPQAMAGRPEMQGPVDEATGSPELAAQPAQMPSHGSVLQAAMRGLRIPGNEAATKMWADGMNKDLERADSQTFRRETREDTQAARRERLAEEQRQQSAMQAERLREAAQIALQKSEDFRYSVDQRRESARENAQLMGQIKLLAANSKPGKPIPSSVHKELSTLETYASNIEGLASTFKPEYSGFVAAAKNAVAPYDPTGTMDTSGAEWWKEYAKSASLIERHALFGATLNANEKASWAAADINSKMSPTVIQSNLTKRATLSQKLFANGVDRYEKGGYNNIREVFDPTAARETVQVESDKPGRAAPAAVRKTINGKTYEQRGGQWYPL